MFTVLAILVFVGLVDAGAAFVLCKSAGPSTAIFFAAATGFGLMALLMVRAFA